MHCIAQMINNQVAYQNDKMICFKTSFQKRCSLINQNHALISSIFRKHICLLIWYNMSTKCKSTRSPQPKPNAKIWSASLPNIWYWAALNATKYMICSSIKCKHRSPPRLWNRKCHQVRAEKRSQHATKETEFLRLGKISSSLVLIQLQIFISQTEKEPTRRRRLWGDQGYREGRVWGGAARP